MLIPPQIFYNEYSCDFHSFKQRLNFDILNDIAGYEKKLYGKELDETERKKLIFYVRSDIRQTFIHSVETLFELIFALEPSEKGQLYDNYIVERLTFSNWKENYKKIDKFSSDIDSLNFLDKTILVDGREISILNHIFYPSLDFNQEFLSKYQIDTEKTIKLGLHKIAKEFSERDDYNAIKHALRGVPVLKSFGIGESETYKDMIEWDFENSVTFYKKVKGNNTEMQIVTKQFYSDFDLKMTNFVSHLIQNVILIRKIIFNATHSKIFEDVSVNFFNEDIINEAFNSVSGMTNITINCPRKSF